MIDFLFEKYTFKQMEFDIILSIIFEYNDCDNSNIIVYGALEGL